MPPKARPGAPLTARQLEVAQLAARGLRSQLIADTLGLSLRTIEAHLANIYVKAGCNRRGLRMLPGIAPAGPARPVTWVAGTMPLEVLLAALRGLRDLEPVERARAAVALMDAARATLAVERRVAMEEALAEGMTQTELAGLLGVGKTAVSEALSGR